MRPTFWRRSYAAKLQEILEVEMTEHIGAEPHQRTASRTGNRNGYKPRTLTTRVGKLNLLVPQRTGRAPYPPSSSPATKEAKALVLALMEMYVQGVSTRRVAKITEELCGTAFSKSTVSSLSARLDTELEAWRERSLPETAYPYLIVDATYEKVRRVGRVVSQGVLIVKSIRARDGRREILAVECADTESEATWGELFRSLKERGLSGVKLVNSDAHAGIKVAVFRHFQGASWQRCQTPFQRDQATKVAYRHRQELAADIRDVFAASDLPTARDRAEDWAEKWRNISPQVVRTAHFTYELPVSLLMVETLLALTHVRRYPHFFRVCSMVSRLGRLMAGN